MMDGHDELMLIADTIETNGGWHIAAIKVRAAADRIATLENALLYPRGCARLAESWQVKKRPAAWRTRLRPASPMLENTTILRDQIDDLMSQVSRLSAALSKEKGGWDAFYKLRKAVGEARYPGMTGEIKATLQETGADK